MMHRLLSDGLAQGKDIFGRPFVMVIPGEPVPVERRGLQNLGCGRRNKSDHVNRHIFLDIGHHLAKEVHQLGLLVDPNPFEQAHIPRQQNRRGHRIPVCRCDDHRSSSRRPRRLHRYGQFGHFGFAGGTTGIPVALTIPVLTISALFKILGLVASFLACLKRRQILGNFRKNLGQILAELFRLRRFVLGVIGIG